MSSRVLRTVWQEWPDERVSDEYTYYAFHVDPLDQSREALAQTLRVDGVVTNLYQARKIASEAEITERHCGFVDGSNDLEICDGEGYTRTGEQVDEILRAHVVKIV